MNTSGETVVANNVVDAFTAGAVSATGAVVGAMITALFELPIRRPV